MGHQPGNDETGVADHAEGGLMRGGGADVNDPQSEKFSPKSTLGFRSTHHWSGK